MKKRDEDGMRIHYETNFAGYFTVLRAIQYLLKNKTLNLTQLGAYFCFVAQADYDSRHKLYGVITRDDEEIATKLGLDKTTIYHHRKQLIEKGLLVEENGLTKVPNFYIFEHKWVKGLVKAPVRYLQHLIENPQRVIENLQELIEKIQQAQLQNKPQSSSVSSKSNLSSFDTSSQEELDIDEIARGLGLEDKGEV